MRHTNIEAFVRFSIKSAPDNTDEVELQMLLDKMSTDELQKFWMQFTANLAFSKANRALPHWKTKQQQTYFLQKLNNYLFYPKEKDANGKYIINREEFEEHIKTHLIKHINEERQIQNMYKNRPLFDKIHSIVGLLVLIMVIPGIICWILAENRNCRDIGIEGVLLFMLLWAIYLLMPIMRWFLRKCGLWK